ncbi:Soluble guanylate cyclase gcy-31 [Tetrabaena socialis]|uniref:Soluble guanylate cyclase gcy-31 n=1 Tax=Tetrabaena socialis TaxID=47790 RepID=A0A2J7ZKQ6_9CHLO|nr:Soluble guanylate cyclase gcy-31 [Tetrabaena socialis]|eukprot:PNH00852.1 Soluble guanylate cyclase gcy-31 [Tetrabaena socialis]
MAPSSQRSTTMTLCGAAAEAAGGAEVPAALPLYGGEVLSDVRESPLCSREMLCSQESLASEAAPAVGTVRCRSMPASNQDQGGRCAAPAFAPASAAPWSEIGGEIRAPPTAADAGAEVAAVMLTRCPASPTSLTPPAPTGSTSHAAPEGAASPDSINPDDMSVSLSLPPAVKLLGTAPCSSGNWGGGGAAPAVLPPLPSQSQAPMPPMLTLSMGGTNRLRIASKRASLDLYNRLFATGAVPAAAGVPPAVALPVLQEVPSREEVPHEGLVERWHEVALTSFEHPQLRRRVILVTQNDVSPRIWAERKLALVMQAEHALLENIFPHHVIEHIAATAAIDLDEQCTLPQQQDGAVTGTAGVEEGRHEQDVGGSAADPTWLPPIRGETFLHLATSHATITVLFCDIQGFTPMCSQMRPVVVMSFLNDLFTRLDRLLDDYGVYKQGRMGGVNFAT